MAPKNINRNVKTTICNFRGLEQFVISGQHLQTVKRLPDMVGERRFWSEGTKPGNLTEMTRLQDTVHPAVVYQEIVTGHKSPQNHKLVVFTFTVYVRVKQSRYNMWITFRIVLVASLAVPPRLCAKLG